MPKTLIPVREADVQRAILDWLAAERIWHCRMNVGGMGGSHKGKRWFVRFGKPGMADILAVYWKELTQELCVLWIEVKRPHTEQSDEQSRFQDEVTEAGMDYMVARSLDDVIAVLK